MVIILVIMILMIKMEIIMVMIMMIFYCRLMMQSLLLRENQTGESVGSVVLIAYIHRTRKLLSDKDIAVAVRRKAY